MGFLSIARDGQACSLTAPVRLCLALQGEHQFSK